MGCKEKHDMLTLKIDVEPYPKGLGGLHSELASTEADGHEIVISGGFGLASSRIYVSVDGKRVLQTDSTPYLILLAQKALELFKAREATGEKETP